MPAITEDSVLWYNVPGTFEDAGLGVPNWGNDLGTFNTRIYQLVEMIQTHNQWLMFHRDSDLAAPPDIGLLRSIHKLYERVTVYLNKWAIPFNEEKFKPVHATPVGKIWKVYPTPYFFVNNTFLKDVSGHLLLLACELMQHTENVYGGDISLRIKEVCASYLNRIYTDMAAFHFGKTKEETSTPGFLLTEADFESYDPDAYYTDVERLATVPVFSNVFTEDQVKVLRQGILVTNLQDLTPYPDNVKSLTSNGSGSGSKATSKSNGTSGSLVQ